MGTTSTLDISAILLTRDEADDELKAAISNIEVAADAYENLVSYRDRVQERQAPVPAPVKAEVKEPEVKEPTVSKPVESKAKAKPKSRTK